jgi:SPP1 family predicted phage head-tail adaptor
MLSRRGASDPGRLRLRLLLEHATASPDGAGGSTLAWSSVAAVAADVTPIKAEEQPRGEGLADMVLHRIVVRHRDDVEPGDRFRLGARTFLILAVSDPAEDGRYLACLAEEEGAP